MIYQTILAPGAPWPTPAPTTESYEQKKARVVRHFSALTLSQRVEAALKQRTSITTPKLKKLLGAPQSSLSKVICKMRAAGAVTLVSEDGVHTLSLGTEKFRHVRTGSGSMLSKQDVERVIELRSKGVPWLDITTKYRCTYETIRRAMRIREMLQ